MILSLKRVSASTYDEKAAEVEDATPKDRIRYADLLRDVDRPGGCDLAFESAAPTYQLPGAKVGDLLFYIDQFTGQRREIFDGRLYLVSSGKLGKLSSLGRYSHEPYKRS